MNKSTSILPMVAVIIGAVAIGATAVIFSDTTPSSNFDASELADQGDTAVIFSDTTPDGNFDASELADQVFSKVIMDKDIGGFQKFSTHEELREFLAEYKDMDPRIPGLSTGYMAQNIVTDSVEREPSTMENSVDREPSTIEAADSVVRAPSTIEESFVASASDVVTDRWLLAESLHSSIDYSTTNIQVKNVDEPDFLKNDGKYIYVLVDGKLSIVDAYPAKYAGIVFESSFDILGYNHYENMFLNNDRLAVIYKDDVYKSIPFDHSDDKRTRAVQNAVTGVVILDISDRSSAWKVGEYLVDGQYHNARMIGDAIYVITESELSYDNPIIPEVRASTYPDTVTSRPDVRYFDGTGRPSSLTTISAIDFTADPGRTNSVQAQTYLLGGGDMIHVSKNSIYLALEDDQISPEVLFAEFYKTGLLEITIENILTGMDRDKILKIADKNISAKQKAIKIQKIIDQSYNDLTQVEKREYMYYYKDMVRGFTNSALEKSHNTIIHKITIGMPGTDPFVYVASADVSGLVLNQFSMDEYDGTFRVATTAGSTSTLRGTYNNVYVFDADMELAGSLEEIARGEKIYSARFVGDMLYLVTFRQIDPFFVIDLSSSTPKILGELKIPGFSDYLHPYGKDSVIGIGRDVGADGRIQNNDGVKVAMFDVSDFYNPKLKDEVIIGGFNTWSAGQTDHRSVLIDEKKQILSLHVNHEDAQYYIYTDDEERPRKQWNGFYVYYVDEDSGFTEAGMIRHDDGDSPRARSLYIEDALYTVTDRFLQIHDLNDISYRIKSILLD